MIVETKETKQYYSSRDFMLKNCGYSELESVFKDSLEEYFKNPDIWVGKFEELIDAVQETLNSFGWSDEEIITEILKQRKEKYLLRYVPENHAAEDYFKVVEFKDGEF